jgi:cell division protein FtsW (lipid II flippase)
MTRPAFTIRETWRYRRAERRLLLWTFLAIASGFAMVFVIRLGNGHPITRTDLLPLLVYGSSLILIHLTLILSRFWGDQILLATASFLAGFGILAQYRVGTFDLEHLASPGNYAFPAGVLIMLAVLLAFKRGRHLVLAKLDIASAVISAAILVVILVSGARFRGAVFAPGRMTPTEALKIFLVIFLAGYLTRHRKSFRRTAWGLPLPPWRVLLHFLAFWGVPMALFIVQRDLGMVVIFSAILLTLLLVATGRWGYLFLAIAAGAAFYFLAFNFMGHGQQRFLVWRDPFQDPTGSGWQTLQALTALFSGGLWGAGFGFGSPDKIPIAASDFIYAAIGEEIGFLGCLLVVTFYLVFFYRAFQLAYRSREPFPLLLAAGLVSSIAAQTFLNIAGVVKLLPLTGITLPFISHGGSSLVTSFTALGLLLAISEGPRPAPEPPATRRRTRRKRTQAPGRPQTPAGKRKPARRKSTKSTTPRKSAPTRRKRTGRE